jgi:hypothetical protein
MVGYCDANAVGVVRKALEGEVKLAQSSRKKSRQSRASATREAASEGASVGSWRARIRAHKFECYSTIGSVFTKDTSVPHPTGTEISG